MGGGWPESLWLSNRTPPGPLFFHLHKIRVPKMARPRKPTNVLELNGAFKKNPQRKREDAETAGLCLIVAGVYVLVGNGWALLAGGVALLMVAGFIRKGLIGE